MAEYRTEKIEVDNLDTENYVSTENMISDKMGKEPATKLPSTKNVTAYYRGDILISNIRPYFKKIWLAEGEGGCSNDVLVFKPRYGIDSDFLYYILMSDDFFAYMMLTAKGTKMPRGDKKKIMDYEIPDYTIDEQEKIARILSCIDHRISNNKRINDNLEEQAEYIFNDMISKSYHVPHKDKNLLDIADFLNGIAIKKYSPQDNIHILPALKIKELRQGFCDNNSDLVSTSIDNKYIIHDGDLIFSWSGSLLVDFWCGGDCILNQHLFKVTSKKYDKWFCYSWIKYHLKRFEILASSMATTMGHIKRKDLQDSKVIIPSTDIYNTYSQIIGPMYDTIIQNKLENKTLTVIRESLLPKLMSGEIDVSGIDI